MVITTKYTTNFLTVKPDMPIKANILINYGSNGFKSLHLSIKASLEKLQTNYIDIITPFLSHFHFPPYPSLLFLP